MMDPALAVAAIATLRDRPDLTEHEHGAIRAMQVTAGRLNHTRLLAERVDIVTMLEEMILRFKPVWERYHRPVGIDDAQPLFEDNPEAMRPRRRAVA